jgi:hypothetical protein
VGVYSRSNKRFNAVPTEKGNEKMKAQGIKRLGNVNRWLKEIVIASIHSLGPINAEQSSTYWGIPLG